MNDVNKLFSDSKFSIKIYINNIRFFCIMMIGLVITILLISVLFTEADKDMRAAIIFVIFFFTFGVIILSIILIRSVFFKKASFILDDKGIYYNNLLVKNYIYVSWKEIKDMDIIGGYLFIYLKDPQSYYLRKFNGKVISENPLYIHLGDLDISNKFLNSMFEFFYDNYSDDEDNKSDENDYKKYYRDYY